MFKVTIEATDICSLGVSPGTAEFALIDEMEPPNKVVFQAPDNFFDVLLDKASAELEIDLRNALPAKVRSLFILAYHHYAMEQIFHEIIHRHLRNRAQALGVGDEEWTKLKQLVPRH